MNIQRVIAKNFSITCIFNQCNLFNNLIHSSLLQMFIEKQVFKCLLKIPL